MTHIQQNKSGWKNKEWRWLVSYWLVVLLLLVPTADYYVDYLVSTAKKWTPKEAPTYAPKTLTYTRLEKNKKDEDGLYHNMFEIFIHSPLGNTDPNAVIRVNIGENSECEYGSRKDIIEAGIGLSSTTSKVLFDCISKEPLLDNGKLFSIIKEK